MKKILFILPIVFTLAAGCSSNQQSVEENQSPKNVQLLQSTNSSSTSSQTNKTTVSTDSKVSWTTYKNEKYGFEISYPAGWDVEVSESVDSGPIIAGYYFGPKGGNGMVDGPSGHNTIVDSSKWAIKIYNKNQVPNTEGQRFENGDKVYVIYNEGLKPDLFTQFVSSFKYAGK